MRWRNATLGGELRQEVKARRTKVVRLKRVPEGCRCSVVAQFDKEASQTRDYCVAKDATLRLRSGQAPRAARPDSLDFARDRLLAAQRTLARDDNQAEALPAIFYSFRRVGLAVSSFWVVAQFESEPLPHSAGN